MQMACSHYVIFPLILIHLATDTLGNIRRLTSNVKNQADLEVVSEASLTKKRLNWAIPRNPAADTLTAMLLAHGISYISKPMPYRR
jgi:hypothetical protein